jgi:hypothetical protein
VNFRSIFSRSIFCVEPLVVAGGVEFLALARRAWTAARRKLAMETPGISLGYWNARKRPARARSSGSIGEDGLAVEEDVAARDRVVRMAGDGLGEGGLAGAVGPHDGVDFAAA